MSLEETILDKVRRLSPAKQEEVLRFADGLQREGTIRTVASRDRSRELQWIEANRAAYADQWVAVEADSPDRCGPRSAEGLRGGKVRGRNGPFRGARPSQRPASIRSGVVVMAGITGRLSRLSIS
jgi:hypothetical protein